MLESGESGHPIQNFSLADAKKTSPRLTARRWSEASAVEALAWANPNGRRRKGWSFDLKEWAESPLIALFKFVEPIFPLSLPLSITEAIRSVGGDPTDLLWDWLAAYGPHGDGFTWSQTRQSPPGYVGIEHLERFLAEREEESPGYLAQVRTRAYAALESKHASLLRRGIQVAAATGAKRELERIAMLVQHDDPAVAADARAAAFHLKMRLRGDAAHSQP